MGIRGPEGVTRDELFLWASEFYLEFRQLAYGYSRPAVISGNLDAIRHQVNDSELYDEEDFERFDRKRKQIQEARLPDSEKEKRFRALEEVQQYEIDVRRRDRAAELATVEVAMPGKPDVLQALLTAKTPKRIRELCKTAFTTKVVSVVESSNAKAPVSREIRVPAWPLHSTGSRFPFYLAKYAEQFIAAKKEPRYPSTSHSVRPTNQRKQLWFLSRALAGAVLGISARTAINILGAETPEQLLEQYLAGKSKRKRKQRK